MGVAAQLESTFVVPPNGPELAAGAPLGGVAGRAAGVAALAAPVCGPCVAVGCVGPGFAGRTGAAAGGVLGAGGISCAIVR